LSIRQCLAETGLERGEDNKTTSIRTRQKFASGGSLVQLIVSVLMQLRKDWARVCPALLVCALEADGEVVEGAAR